jgi:hypothetical protein
LVIQGAKVHVGPMSAANNVGETSLFTATALIAVNNAGNRGSSSSLRIDHFLIVCLRKRKGKKWKNLKKKCLCI